ncbi:MAG: bifunctional phosphoribosylaminoimidazolecarboxamide formyltransferase/IMP cyclohydrolase [Acidobacteria bacterium RIFCSPLOWO2_02_FULL_68_18]|nr:MAG: bifunctional phosphoribosylaminoimidazolecarboxamide formyltransferase/IMP cyclohydrolase [Acidobacteria bacterium RIFCSPLOWO2_02_FULL_68_18]OFW49857.1 MAG: bifunctional phosphoribosylaminoimidazolecarboxamide formyltransferase/IMP cyclohydrolase [Acidobacteria bacterium RIFCSPLOWO2_12_FULL_68_19]
MSRALLSVSDKSGLVDFARGLAARGFDLVSTGGTARALQQAGLSVVAISEVTGFPEMMDGRVKTLHPRVHGGILARRSRADDLAAAAAHGITLIDLVVVNLYPFAKAAANPDTPFDALVEEIDIGGPSLVRAAAKNFEDVLVVVSPADYPAVLDALDRGEGPSRQFRFELAKKAFAHTGRYDTAIAATLATIAAGPDAFTRGAPPLLPPSLPVDLRKVRDLRYGENPHQQAALYEGFGPHPGFRVLQGKELSYTNLLDLDAAARIAMEFSEPAAVVIKHTNPCGAATGRATAEAYVRARDADALAAFGGIVGLNRTIDVDTARAIVSTFIEAVVAPEVDEEARPVLAAKANMRVVVPHDAPADAAEAGTRHGSSGLEIRSIVGGMLVQTRDVVREAHGAWPGSDGPTVVTKRQPTAEEWQALRFAWRVCAHVKSNAVIFTSADRTLAIGAGQMSRVDAVKVARMKADAAGDRTLAGAVAASDAFFPFRDGLDAVAAAGATAVVQPGGSVRDQEVIGAADEHGLAMVFTGRRHFRH